MDNNNISQFANCVNCGACYNSCPKDAIKIVNNDFFYKLFVDESKCINCGKCVRVCPLNTHIPNLNLKYAYAGWNNNPEKVKNSSSGGAFTALADYVISKSGVVYGAVYSDDYKEVLFRSTKEVDIDEIRRSKYVESQIGFCFRSVKADLDLGLDVLFCGTPCQVAGLMFFLGKNYDKLITCDFACGGLPSHKIYAEYLSWLENKYKSQITDVNFRPKLYGWSLYSIKILFSNYKAYKNLAVYDPYFFSFVCARTSIRDNCLNCKFSINHYSDLIIADFWKWKTISNLKNDETGISLIISNSDKGQTVLEAVKESMTLVEVDLAKASYNFKVSPPLTEEYILRRKLFFDSYKKEGLQKASMKVGMEHGIKALVKKIYTALRTESNNNEK